MDEIDLVRYLQSLQQKLEESRRQLEESLRQWQEERQQQQRQEEDQRLEKNRRYQQEQDDRRRREEDRRLEETRRYQQERDLAQQRQRNLQHQQAEQFSLDKAAPQQAIAQREEGQVEVRKLSTSDFYTIETGQEIDRHQEIIQGIERHANHTPHELDRKAIEIHQSTPRPFGSGRRTASGINPSDVRSLNWSHRSEGAKPETIAAALVEEDPKEPFFGQAAKSLLSDLYERCQTNAQVWEVLSSFTIDELCDFVKGGLSGRYFTNERTGGSVLSTLVNFVRFYRSLPDVENGFSFSRWGREDDPRWIFVPIFEDDIELYNPIYSAGFELVLRGLLSNESRHLKTAVIIDELGALQRLNSRTRLLSESRKFGGCPMLGSQTEAQITKRYGKEDTRILLQGTATKLILNCRDSETAEMMSNLIGKQERIDYTRSEAQGSLFSPATRSCSEQIRETHVVLPSELQALPKLEGYLTIADGTPPAKVNVPVHTYPKVAQRLVPVPS